MSVELSLLTRRDRLPRREEWNSTLNAAGFDVTLDPFDWSATGYLPARMLGVQTGFELSFDEEARGPLGRLFKSASSAVGSVSARFHSRLFEAICATCSIAVLQRMMEVESGDYAGEALSCAEAMDAAHCDYSQGRIIIEHLRCADALLAWDQPALGAGETEEERRRMLDQLVENGLLIPEGSGAGTVFRLHKNRRKDLELEVLPHHS